MKIRRPNSKAVYQKKQHCLCWSSGHIHMCSFQVGQVFSTILEEVQNKRNPNYSMVFLLRTEPRTFVIVGQGQKSYNYFFGSLSLELPGDILFPVFIILQELGLQTRDATLILYWFCAVRTLPTEPSFQSQNFQGSLYTKQILCVHLWNFNCIL